MKAAVCALAFLIAGSMPASAQEAGTPAATPKTPVVRERQINQHARIRQGVRSGELTRGEAAKLRSEQRDIRQDKKMAKSDGQVTPAERRHIAREQNKASRDISRLKHNNRTR